MKWGKSIFIVLIAGMMVLVVTGCSQVEESTPDVEQDSTTTNQTIPDVENAMPSYGDENSIPIRPEGTSMREIPINPELDLATAAEKLEIDEQQLSEALEQMQQGLMDISAVATELGVSEDLLLEVLGFSDDFSPTSGPPAGGVPPEGGVPPDQLQQ
jgi:hypothetical protein